MDGKLRNMASVYLLRGEKLLLLYRIGGSVVSDIWVASAGGHFEKEELNDAKACVLRELEEELGLTEKDITGLALRYVTLRRTEKEIRQNYYFFACLKEDIDSSLISDEGKCAWFDSKDVLSLPMPITAKYMLEHYLSTGRYDHTVYGGITQENKMVFGAMPVF